MQIKIILWLLSVIYLCHVACGPTHFIFGISLRCEYNQTFKYSIDIWEHDFVKDDRVNDGYKGEARDGDFIYLRGKQNYGDADADYELYAEIYHTCTVDESTRYIEKRNIGDARTEKGFEYLESIFTLTNQGTPKYKDWNN